MPDERSSNEFWVGGTCFAIWEPARFGGEFRPQPNSIVLLHVDDVAAARSELEAKGVPFHGETFDTGVCHMASFSDPDGNELTLHKRYAPYPDGRADDRRRARRLRPRSGDGHGEANHFYGELLGLERNPNSPDGDWVEYEAGNVTLAVMTPETHDYEFTPLPPGRSHSASPTSRPRRRSSRRRVSGREMWDSGVCRGAGVSDPDGNRILLHRRYAPYPDGTRP